MCNEQSNRIKQLEEAMAHQEALLQDLNVQLVQQWQAIETMERLIKELDVKIEEESVSQPISKLDASAPPHY